MTIFSSKIKNHISVFNELAKFEGKLNSVVDICVNAFENGNKLILCGNGGSASDSQHIAGELVGRFLKDRSALPAISLNTDTSVMTAIANDYAFSKIFSRQLQALGKPGDVLLVLSTSGNSENILECCKLAKALGIAVIGFLGNDGGNVKRHCSVDCCVTSNNTAIIQEAHIFMGHFICEQIENSIKFDNIQY